MKIQFQDVRAALVSAVSVFGLTGCPLDEPPKPEASMSTAERVALYQETPLAAATADMY